jgi:outer membrane protein TolC
VYTLKECIDKALKTNLTLVQTKGYFEQAKADALAAKGAFLPDLNWSISGYYNHNKWTSFQNPITGEFETGEFSQDVHGYQASLGASLMLFDGFGNFYNMARSNATVSSYRNRVSQQELNTAYNVKSQYFSLLQAQATFKITQKALERTQELMKIAQTKYELGSASRSDVLKAKVSLSQAQLDMLTSENRVSIAQANLNYAIGEPVHQEISVEDVEISGVDYSLANVSTQALSSNPGYLSAQDELRAAKHGVQYAKSDYLPTLSLSASKYWVGPELGQLDDWWSRNYTTTVSGRLSFNIFDRFMTKQRNDYAKANLHSAEYGVSDSKRAVELEAREAYLNLQETVKARELSDEESESAQEDYKLAQEKYTLGAATILDILDAEISLRTAESHQVDSKYSYLLAVARLKTVMGIIE